MACYQVIFKIKNSDGVVRDYCREQPPMVDGPTEDGGWDIREANETEARAWADKQLKVHGLHSYDLQYW